MSSDATPAIAAAPPRSPALPARLDAIYGRSELIAELEASLVKHRFLTLVGPGGIGKTTVAAAIARRRDEAGARVEFVDFASVASEQSVTSSVALPFAVPVTAGDPVPGILSALAEEGEVLIVLDNCEHLIDVIASLAERLSKGAAHVMVLATSREPLRAQGEWVHRLGALAIPPVDASVAEAMDHAAVQLFVGRAKAAGEQFALTPDTVGAVCEICLRLDGIPLAIEFAAARLDVMDVATLATRLEDRFGLLTSGRRTALPRHRTLRATMDWSFDLLDPASRQFLQRLTVFRAYFDLADAHAIGAPGEDEYETLMSIDELCAKSMIIADRSAGQLRYRLLETTRHYAAEKLDQSGESNLIMARYARRCIALLERAATPAPGETQPGFAQAGSRIIEDTRSALQWAFSARGDIAIVIQLTLAAAPLWFLLSLTEELCHNLERAIDAIHMAQFPDPHTEVKLLCFLGQAAYHSRWPPDQSARAYARALPIAEQLGNPYLLNDALSGVWTNHSSRGAYDQCLAYADRLLALFPSNDGAPLVVARNRFTAALSLHLAGDEDRSAEIMHDLLAPREAASALRMASLVHTDGELSVICALVRVLWLQGFADQALAITRTAVTRALQQGHALTICTIFSFGFAPVALWAGDMELAEDILDHLDHFSRRIGVQQWLTWARGYRLAVDPSAEPPGMETGLQIDTGATMDRPDALAAAIATGRDRLPSWCQAEILRRKILADSTLTRAQRVAALRETHAVAKARGERAWCLRIAMSLASLDGDGEGSGRNLLAATLAEFTEGFGTRDVMDARARLAASGS